jgi:hypothetical protein
MFSQRRAGPARPGERCRYAVLVVREETGGRATIEFRHNELKVAFEAALTECLRVGWLAGEDVPLTQGDPS